MTHLRKASILSVGTIFFWAILNVSLRYMVIEYNCHPVVIACSNAFFCALALLAIGKHNVGVKKIFKNFNTWFFGITQLLKNICMIYAFVYISSTEANLLTNIEIVFSVLLAWVFMKRKPNALDIFAMILIFCGCMILVAGLPMKVMLLATFWVFSASFLTSLRTVAAELHSENKKGLSLKERCSVTGWILLISAVVLVVFFACLSVAAGFLPQEIITQSTLFKELPTPMQFIALPNILGGLIVGAGIYAISMYFYFYAVSISNSEYFMLFRSGQAVFTYGIEMLFAMFTALPMVYLSATDWFAAFTIIFCSLSMIMMRSSRGKAFSRLLNKSE